MYRVSDEEIDYILNDIKAHGVVLEDLQYNLLDHMCCIIEDEMSEEEDFYKFYEKILPRFFKQNLKELQEETDNLLTFKHYYAMKNILKISGIASALLTLLGATLKTFHLPGAAITIVLGGLIFSLIFLPLMIALKFKDEAKRTDKIVLSIGFLLGIMASMGIIFKLMHWPYANFLMRWGLTFFVFGYVPLYFLSRIRRAELKFNTTVNSVLMMACGGMLYALFNLGYSNEVKNSIAASYDFMNDNAKELITANEKLISANPTKPEANDFHLVSSELYNKIEEIKVFLIAQVEGVTLEQAKQMSLIDVENYNDNKIIKRQFESATGELSLAALMDDINKYNSKVSSISPEHKERLIAVEKLQLKNTVVSVLLHQLSQIQLEVVTNENAYLNQVSEK